jgi:hypothetical protein
MPKALPPKELVFAVTRKTCTAFSPNRATSESMRSLFLAVFALGCGVQPRPAPGTVAQAPALPSAVPPVASSAKPSSPVAASKIQLTPLDAPPLPAALPRFEVLQPSFGDTLDPRFAVKQPVRIRAEASVLSADAEGVVVSLDGGRPRRLLPDSALVLGDLLAEGQRLVEGPHALLVLAVAADGRALRVPEGSALRPLTVIGFFVGARSGDPPSPSTTQLFCQSPVGTHYLKPDGSLVFELLPLGVHSERVRLHVQASGAELDTVVDPNRSYSVRGLPVGDVRFSAGEAPGPRAECVATVNLEPVERTR